MSAPTLLRECEAAGVSVYMTSDDVKLRGSQKMIRLLAPILRPYKAAILSYLQMTAPDKTLLPSTSVDGSPGLGGAGILAEEKGDSDVVSAFFIPLTVEQVEQCQAQIEAAVKVLQAYYGWDEEQIMRIVAASRHQPVSTLLIDALALTAWAGRVLGAVQAAEPQMDVRRCCAECANHAEVVTDLTTRCLVARRQPDAPWRDWLDAEDQPNACGHFERRS